MQPASQVRTEKSEQESGELQYRQFSVPAPGAGQYVSVSLGYRRSTDFDRADQPGQDYAVVRGGEGFVVGVVSDGVSQSFYGHLAAQFVAERLLEFLWEWRENPPSANHLNRELRAFERDFKIRIDDYVLPAHLQPLQRGALEQTRERAGSQAVFAAFVLDVEARRLRLFEVGDALAVVHCARGETNGSHSKVIQANHKGRWSSVGRTDLLLEEIDEWDVKGVIVKSDGASIWGENLGSRKFGRAAFFEVAPELANYDDVSFVAAVFQDESVETIPVVNEVRPESRQPAPPVAAVPAVQPAPRPATLPPTNHAADQSYFAFPSKPVKWPGDWKMFTAGFAAGILLSAIGFGGVMWGRLVTLKPKGPNCRVELSDNLLETKAAETHGKLDVIADEKCKWSVTNIPSWIKLHPSSELNGKQRLTFSVAQNMGPAREGAFGVGGYGFWVKQDEGCDYQLEPGRKSLNAKGGQERLQIKAASGCQWTASSEQDWIEINTGATGQGDGFVAYTVKQNSGAAREGLIKIGAATFKIEQQAAAQSPTKKAPADQARPKGEDSKVRKDSKAQKDSKARKNSKAKTDAKPEKQN
jgi:protein phosphatase 2C-like protein/all-beta uncharacterized protein